MSLLGDRVKTVTNQAENLISQQGMHWNPENIYVLCLLCLLLLSSLRLTWLITLIGLMYLTLLFIVSSRMDRYRRNCIHWLNTDAPSLELRGALSSWERRKTNWHFSRLWNPSFMHGLNKIMYYLVDKHGLSFCLQKRTSTHCFYCPVLFWKPCQHYQNSRKRTKVRM